MPREPKSVKEWEAVIPFSKLPHSAQLSPKSFADAMNHMQDAMATVLTDCILKQVAHAFSIPSELIGKTPAGKSELGVLKSLPQAEDAMKNLVKAMNAEPSEPLKYENRIDPWPGSPNKITVRCERCQKGPDRIEFKYEWLDVTTFASFEKEWKPGAHVWMTIECHGRTWKKTFYRVPKEGA